MPVGAPGAYASPSLATSASSDVALSRAQKKAVEELQKLESKSAQSTVNLATNASGRGQIVNILT